MATGGEEAGEEPDMVLGSNREVTVRDVKPESCDLTDFGLSSADGPVPVIETLSAVVNAGDLDGQGKRWPHTLDRVPSIGSATPIRPAGLPSRAANITVWPSRR